MSRIIELHRLHTLHNLAQDDPEVKAWMGMSYRALGPCYDVKAKAPISGLSFSEKEIIMPEILSLPPTDQGFNKAVNHYFATEIVTSIPAHGVKLEIGLRDDNQELSKTNLPLRPKDFIAYRHAQIHPDVAENKDAGESTFGKKFYIHDPKGTSDTAVKLNKLEDKATELYFRFKDNVVKVDQILTLLGVKIDKFNHEEKVIKLKELAQKGPGIESEQTDRLNRFISVATDKDLEYKFLITEMIGAQWLKRIGKNIVFSESSEPIGDDLDDAVLYFKNPKNSSDANTLRARYEQLVKRGKEYLPTDIA